VRGMTSFFGTPPMLFLRLSPFSPHFLRHSSLPYRSSIYHLHFCSSEIAAMSAAASYFRLLSDADAEADAADATATPAAILPIFADARRAIIYFIDVYGFVFFYFR